jgi:hypothetical protein
VNPYTYTKWDAGSAQWEGGAGRPRPGGVELVTALQPLSDFALRHIITPTAVRPQAAAAHPHPPALPGSTRQWVPCQLRDPGSVDQRRAAMSLGPLAENLARITEQYGPPAPQVTSCHGCGSSVEFWLPDPGEEASVECANCGHTIRIAVKAPACACEADADHCQARHNAREPLADS